MLGIVTEVRCWCQLPQPGSGRQIRRKAQQANVYRQKSSIGQTGKSLGQAYNTTMNHQTIFSLKITVFSALLAAATLCGAQTAPASAAPAAQPSRGDQMIQKIRIEDAGSRIDEVRVGGQTQSITVQPKTRLNVPPYEIKPSDTSRGAAPSTSNGDTTGSRVWNVLKF